MMGNLQAQKNKGCNFCQRYGLPILLVRPAVMEKNDHLPVMPETIENKVIAQGETAYTLRLLRSGFLYIRDEFANSWINYFVTEKGYYYPLQNNQDVPESVTNGKIKPCITEPSELARASLITLPVLPPPMKNDLFWLAWSEVEWTDSVRKKHEDKAYREQYMQRFDLDKWLHNTEEKQTLPITALQDTVAEYSRGTQKNNIKAWSPTPLEKMNPMAGITLQQAANDLMPGKGAIVVLQDPPALAQDLAALMNHRLETHFEKHPKYERGLALSASLEMLKEALCAQYARDRISEGMQFEKDARQGIAVTSGIISPSFAATHADSIHNLVNQSLKTQIDIYWAGYEKYIDREKQTAFLADYNSKLSMYKQQVITPMVTMYLAHFKSQIMLDYFNHNFDPNDINSGALFTQSILDCISGMQDKEEIQQFVQAQLATPEVSESNLLLRAALLNQTLWIDNITQAISSDSEYEDLPWYRLAEGFKDIANHNLLQIQLISEKYFNSLSSFLLKTLNNAINKAPLPILVSMASMDGKKLVRISYTGERKHFITAAVEQVASMTDLDSKASHQQIRHYLEIEESRGRISGLQLDGKQEGRFFLAVDVNDAESSKNSPKPVRSQVAVKAFRSAEQIRETVFPTEWRRKLSLAKGNTINKLTNDAAQSLPFSGCVLSVMLQIHVLWKTTDDAMKGQVNNTEVVTKFIANIISAGGALLDATERVIFKFHTLRLKSSIRLNYGRIKLVKLATFLKNGIRFCAWFGAVAVGWDIYHLYDEFANKENNVLGTAYIASATGGSMLFVASLSPVFLAFLGPVGLLIALTLVFGSAIFIGIHSKDDIQKWLSACLWRKIPENEKTKGRPPEIWMDRLMEMTELANIIGYTQESA